MRASEGLPVLLVVHTAIFSEVLTAAGFDAVEKSAKMIGFILN
jgi:hypothetical protein